MLGVELMTLGMYFESCFSLCAPNIENHSNAPCITQMVPQEHLTWNYEDPPKVRVPHPKFTLIHNTKHRGPHLDRHPVGH